MNTGPVAREGKLIAAVIAAVDEYLSGIQELEKPNQTRMNRWKLSSIHGTAQYNRTRNWNGLDRASSQVVLSYNKT